MLNYNNVKSRLNMIRQQNKKIFEAFKKVALFDPALLPEEIKSTHEYINLLYNAFIAQRNKHLEYVEKNHRQQIEGLQAYYADNIQNDIIDDAKRERGPNIISESYRLLLKHEPINATVFLQALGINSNHLKAGRLWYDLNKYVMVANKKINELNHELSQVRDLIHSAAIDTGSDLRIVITPDNLSKYDVFFDDIEVNINNADHTTRQQALERNNASETSRLDNNYYISRFSYFIALVLGLGEGGVAGDEIYKKNYSIWFAGLVLTGGWYTNHTLIYDDMRDLLTQMMTPAGQQHQPLSNMKKFFSLLMLGAAIPAGITIGALQRTDNIDIFGPVCASGVALCSMIGFSALFASALLGLVKDNVFYSLASYLKSCYTYGNLCIEYNADASKIMQGIIWLLLYILSESNQLIISLGFNLLYTVAQGNVLGEPVGKVLKEFGLYTPLGQQYITYITIITMATFGGIQIQRQMITLADTLWRDRSFAKAQAFIEPINVNPTPFIKKTNWINFLMNMAGLCGLACNTAGMAALVIKDKTLDVTQKVIDFVHTTNNTQKAQAIGSALLIGATLLRSGVVNDRARQVHITKNSITAKEALDNNILKAPNMS